MTVREAITSLTNHLEQSGGEVTLPAAKDHLRSLGVTNPILLAGVIQRAVHGNHVSVTLPKGGMAVVRLVT